MIIANEYEIPDNCHGCPWKDEPSYQGNICYYCPVLICSDLDPLCPPEGYRKDWAKIFFEWFKGDRKEYPHLPLMMKEE
jgi:hypothetical protein